MVMIFERKVNIILHFVNLGAYRIKSLKLISGSWALHWHDFHCAFDMPCLLPPTQFNNNDEENCLTSLDIGDRFLSESCLKIILKPCNNKDQNVIQPTDFPCNRTDYNAAVCQIPLFDATSREFSGSKLFETDK